MLIHVLIVLLLLAIYFVIFEPYVETFAPVVANLAGKRELWNFGNE